MSHVDDGKLNALLDGELESAEAAEVEAHIAGCPDCSRRLEEARRFLAEAGDLLGALELPPRAAASTEPARRVSKTAKELAIDVDGATQQSPAIGAGAPERLFHHGARGRSERSGLDYSTLAWAATIVLAIGVGFLANEVRHAGGTEPQAPARPNGSAAPNPAGGAPAAEKSASPAAPAGGAPQGAPVRRDGPLSAKAPPGQTKPVVPNRSSASGIGHKNLEASARTVTDRVAAAPAARVAGVVVTSPSVTVVSPPGAPPAAGSGGRGLASGAADRAAPALALGGVAPAPAPTPAANQPAPVARGVVRRASLEEAVASLGGTIRLIDGLQIARVEIVPGRWVADADSARDVVRVVYSASGQELRLDQQRLAPAADAASAAPREAEAPGPGGQVLTTTADGLNGLLWTDRGFWLSLSGHVPADSLRALAGRVR